MENRKKNKVFHRISKKNGMQGGRFISEDKKRKEFIGGTRLECLKNIFRRTYGTIGSRSQKRTYGRFIDRIIFSGINLEFKL